MQHTSAVKVTEKIEVDTLTVTCESNGHPRVALRLDPVTKSAVCP